MKFSYDTDPRDVNHSAGGKRLEGDICIPLNVIVGQSIKMDHVFPR